MGGGMDDGIRRRGTQRGHREERSARERERATQRGTQRGGAEARLLSFCASGRPRKVERKIPQDPHVVVSPSLLGPIHNNA